MNKLTVTLFSLCFLSACGGGEDGASTPNQNSSPVVQNPDPAPDTGTTPDPEPTPAPEPTPEPTPDVTSMADLVIDTDFDLSTKFSLLIDVDLKLEDQRAYLNICQKLTGQVKADRHNCVLRTALGSAPLNTVLTISRSDIQLVAEVWFYDNNTTPMTYEWQYDANNEQQQFQIR
ncbi:hypothetical protein J8L98_03275 [Pseudoalteromonas sp. MMG013]|uniref:hypothetical protein n=1 Tax=Pseudoalteromonas sp. MMG013 TaxID=2822687 RepID=UPI001B367CF4|nr:hypothetical protein [Pseudoalteromonas sp. MMG013]MBQ4860717.1 hypothetical protein [Pseudoalteromonas sp. MMG013]